MDQHRNMTITIADKTDREYIYALRHDIYASELGQHQENNRRLLTDPLDDCNTYIVVKNRGEIAGFVSVTPPGGRYGLDKYIGRDEFPYLYEAMYEGRIFSIVKKYRSSRAALFLFYGFFRWVQDHGGSRIVTYGRKELVDMYRKTGLSELGRTFSSGKLTFSLMSGEIPVIKNRIGKYEKLINKLAGSVFWDIGVPLQEENQCYHGGRFFESLGTDFSSLEKIPQVINADVLDAWFPPAPAVTEALAGYLPWLCKTSPPTHSEGLQKVISRVRGIPGNSILTGAGSSSLMYLAFPRLLDKSSKVLLLDPTYGEYRHIMQSVIGCNVEYFALSEEDGYQTDLEKLACRCKKGYDLVVLVNPNNPTGHHIPAREIEEFVRTLDENTLLWIDETYSDYLGETGSLEHSAWKYKNVILSKSMSKVYALSGLRAAYLCANPRLLARLRTFSPPWAVSLPAQVAAVKALESYDYYARKYAETHKLREQFREELENHCAVKTFPGSANFFMISSTGPGISTSGIIEQCAKEQVFLRDIGSMGQNIPLTMFRTAVKDENTNSRIIEAIKKAAGARELS